ncbi:Putative Flp pilus-assembly TadE/G-like [Nitrosospira multiformis]|uniref:Putative Flp pilus-assembly TadE/G-like n=1 Tax=Nitrosospira multiformis TaxID=1231 RepID=A0A1I0CAH9_9PROT|nr:pilus assembly protein TadG-related protein [Nitrosospira multiformis]SET16388.1 Putative Flp pilus-assembly TadE/G-like [Nitrosospira multiformis]
MKQVSGRLRQNRRNRNYPGGRQEKGVVAIIVALSLVVLVGFAGLALDLGKLYVAKSELQNSADACALAAARELTGANTNQLVLAEAAGMTAGMRHNVLFQDEMIALAIDDSVTFSQTLNGVYQAKAAVGPTEAVLMQYARCTVGRTGIANWFIQVLNLLPGVTIGDQAVAAAAVATRTPSQITSCAVPVGVCSSAITPSTPPGTWLQSVIGPAPSGGGSGNLTGNFMWVDYTPPGGGASELGGILTGPGVCNLPAIGTQVGEAGVMSSLAAHWNSRFGIYQGSVKQGESIPDYTGRAYTDAAGSWPSKFNAFADFRSKRAVYAPYQGDTTTGLRTNGTVIGSAALQASGGDRRLATAAVVDCSGFTSGSTVAPVQSWACVLMLHPINTNAGGTGTGATRMYLEYLGRSDEEGSPCATSGVPGGPASGGPLVPVLVR